MPTPRPYAKLVAQYFADDTLKCWYRENPNMEWKILWYPSWDAGGEYYVGHEPPPPDKRTITLTVNGIECPAPIAVAPKLGPDYWIPDTSVEYFCKQCRWTLHSYDYLRLERGQCFASADDAAAAARAMIAPLKLKGGAE